MGGDGARSKDWLRARGHHLCLTDTISLLGSVFDVIVVRQPFLLPRTKTCQIVSDIM